jgi:polysaccharide biosynthesis PFTS motif protein
MRGSFISFYFYSTNCEAFKLSDVNSTIPYGWCAMSWPKYLVWDEYQADFVRRAVGMQANIVIVGAIWFQSSTKEISSLDRVAVAVFDVTPHRASVYCTYGIGSEYYTPNVALPFLEDVKNVTQRLSAFMVWKRKRNIGRIAHPRYRYFSGQLAEHSHVVIVEPDISTNRIIENCAAVISMPFTSTAVIAREMGKPSIYYDPSGLLHLDDRASHGIPILSGVTQLEAWLSVQLAPKHSKTAKILSMMSNRVIIFRALVLNRRS